jgi:hypothetical protein
VTPPGVFSLLVGSCRGPSGRELPALFERPTNLKIAFRNWNYIWYALCEYNLGFFNPTATLSQREREFEGSEINDPSKKK